MAPSGRPPGCSAGEVGQAFDREAQDGLVGKGARQMQHDAGLQLDDAGGQLHQAQPQGVELRDTPGGMLGYQAAQRSHQPVGAGVQHQAELVGGGTAA